MTAILVALEGPLAGQRFPIEARPITFGRDEPNDVVITSQLASRLHAELRPEGNNHVLYDRGSRNGTLVNGNLVTIHQLQDNDTITIGEEVFRFEMSTLLPAAGRATTVISNYAVTQIVQPVSPANGAAQVAAPVLQVIVAGGGPVGLSFALLLDHLMGPRVSITVYDGRWTQDGGKIVWKGPEQGSARRLQVVTLQSRQYAKLPAEIQERLFNAPAYFSEMWPIGPDSINDLGPRNIRIAYIEDQLLALANEKTGRIQLIPENFDPVAAHESIVGQHVLAICEGGRSSTRDHFVAQFGAADASIYSLDGQQVQDMVLGLRVKSTLSDPMSVLLTVAQNRFLLNSLRGEGFLNMRLTDEEIKEAVGIDPLEQKFTSCVQSTPCLMERSAGGEFSCSMHRAYFLPALLRGSPLWARVLEGLQLFGVPEENLSAVTGFRLDMVQRPRFTAQLFPRSATTPGTFGFLLGDAANAIHFWPGRGLNSGLASAISLARNLAATWNGRGLRDADFVRHEAVMSMLQYRHKSRAWRQMVTIDETGTARAIKDQIAQGIAEAEQAAPDKETEIGALMARLRQIRDRLAARLDGLPDDATLLAHLSQLTPHTIHTLLVSDAWDTGNVGGEEVDVDWLIPDASVASPVGGSTRQSA